MSTLYLKTNAVRQLADDDLFDDDVAEFRGFGYKLTIVTLTAPSNASYAVILDGEGKGRSGNTLWVMLDLTTWERAMDFCRDMLAWDEAVEKGEATTSFDAVAWRRDHP